MLYKSADISKTYHWYVKTLIGCSILTGVSFCLHCAGKITPTTWLILGNGRVGVGTDWTWIRHRIHATSGIPPGKWTLKLAKSWDYSGTGYYGEFSFFALLLVCWLSLFFFKNFLSYDRKMTSGDWFAVLVAFVLAIVTAFICHIFFDGTPRYFWPGLLKHIATVGFALVPTILIEKVRRSRRRQRESRELSIHCQSCLYDLSGNVNDVCSECGLQIPPKQWEFLRQCIEHDEPEKVTP